MAVSLSNHYHYHSLFAPPRLSVSSSSSSSSSSPNSSKSKTLAFFHRPILGFTLTNSSPVTNKCSSSSSSSRSFKSYLAAQDSEVPTTNDLEEAGENDVQTSESGADQQHLSSLTTLIKVYKEATLAGDEKTISDIEARIHVIENEKNELVQNVLTLSTEITSGKEKYIRLQADFDNFRKRSEKDRLTIRSDAQGEVIESLLPMVDNFERAKQQLKLETEKEQKIDASYQGIYKQFVEIMRNLRVAVVATVGKPFDPSLHEAIAREESQEFKEGVVIQEFRRGFLLGDRLLRPAMVKVSAGPGRKKAPAATEKSTEHPATAAGIDER